MTDCEDETRKEGATGSSSLTSGWSAVHREDASPRFEESRTSSGHVAGASDVGELAHVAPMSGMCNSGIGGSSGDSTHRACPEGEVQSHLTEVSPAGKQVAAPLATVSRSSLRVGCSVDQAATVAPSANRSALGFDLRVDAGTAHTAATGAEALGGIRRAEQVELNRCRQEVDDLENAQLSMEVQKILAPQGSLTGISRLSKYVTNVTRLSVEAVHRDRLLEALKDLVAALEKELANATAETGALQTMLTGSRFECDMLLQKISRLEKERDQVSLPPLPASAAVLAEEQKCKAAAVTTPLPEMAALQQKYEKQKLNVNKLVSANHRWEEHCKQQAKGYEQQIADCQQQIAGYEQDVSNLVRRISEQDRVVEGLTSRLDEFKVNEEKRQKDIDRLLLSTKKRLETVEAERDVLNENLRSVENERSQAREALATTRQEADFLRQELEQCRATGSRLHVERQHWEADSSRRQASTTTGRMPMPVHNVAELREQITLLQQQLEVYRDDFNTERSDRERLQQKVLDLQNQHERLKNDFGTQQRQLVRADEDLARSRAEIERLQSLLAVQATEIRSLRQTAVKAWRCSRCTYKNGAGRKFCEICGFAGSGGHEDDRPPTVDPSLFTALPPVPSAPEPTGDINGSRTSNLSAELVVADDPHHTAISPNVGTRR